MNQTKYFIYCAARLLLRRYELINLTATSFCGQLYINYSMSLKDPTLNILQLHCSRSNAKLSFHWVNSTNNKNRSNVCSFMTLYTEPMYSHSANNRPRMGLFVENSQIKCVRQIYLVCLDISLLSATPLFSNSMHKVANIAIQTLVIPTTFTKKLNNKY